MADLQAVATCWSAHQAEFIAASLRSAGFHPLVRPNIDVNYLGGGPGGADVVVSASEAMTASGFVATAPRVAWAIRSTPRQGPRLSTTSAVLALAMFLIRLGLPVPLRPLLPYVPPLIAQSTPGPARLLANGKLYDGSTRAGFAISDDVAPPGYTGGMSFFSTSRDAVLALQPGALSTEGRRIWSTLSTDRLLVVCTFNLNQSVEDAAPSLSCDMPSLYSDSIKGVLAIISDGRQQSSEDTVGVLCLL